MSALSGIVVSRVGQYRTIMQLGLAIFTIGMGLMTKLNANSNVYVLANLCRHIN